MGGNTYLTVDGQDDKVTTAGITQWKSPTSVFSTFFKPGRSGRAIISLQLGKQEQESVIAVSVGRQVKEVTIPKGGSSEIEVGDFKLPAGYVQVKMQGLSKIGEQFGQVKAMLVHYPNDGGFSANYVKDNIDNRFYWGRRGPSVHLSFVLPEDREFKWFYNEITVPKGEDPNGSYYMANGFAEGYFGIQANSDTERRVLFSVWSPFHTDNPEEIPENQKIILLKKGELVNTGEFGNEGSGGQSFLRFNWKAGNTYRFLNAVEPDGKGNTIYTAYFFAPEVGEWQLIASFLRPLTNTWYKRPHSFLENFLDTNGHKTRMAYYTHQWARDTHGHWVELNLARFTADDIGRRGYRKDYAGGLIEGKFFLKNGGFFNEPTDLNSYFTRPKIHQPPAIDFESLE